MRGVIGVVLLVLATYAIDQDMLIVDPYPALPEPIFKPQPIAEPRPQQCWVAWTTGYVRTEFSAFTFDGTSIYTPEAIAAAGWNIPLGIYVEVDELGVFRIADRGMLAPGQLDIAVWSRPEAYAITGYRRACLL